GRKIEILSSKVNEEYLMELDKIDHKLKEVGKLGDSGLEEPLKEQSKGKDLEGSE
ncbi:hypothetical protein KI387_026527, partial [Taxus chinensis]